VYRIESTGLLRSIDRAASNNEWRAWTTTVDV